MKNAIVVEKLTKKYSSVFTLGEINLTIPKGEIIGLIGENGAGKTTFIKSLLGIVNPSSGSVKIFDKELTTNELEIKENIGVVLDNMFFPEIMNAHDIEISMQGIFKNWDSSLFHKYLTDFNLPENQPLKSLSKGMRKKLEIAVALSHHPKLLILDEPTSGLDPVVRNEILDIFLNFIQDEEHTILLSTHITSDLEHIADEIIFIDKGKVILNKNRDELLDNYGIMKCNLDEFSKIDSKDIVSYKKNKYNYDILVSNRFKMSKKYKDFVIDKITLEDLMVLIIKGEK